MQNWQKSQVAASTLQTFKGEKIGTVLSPHTSYPIAEIPPWIFNTGSHIDALGKCTQRYLKALPYTCLKVRLEDIPCKKTNALLAETTWITGQMSLHPNTVLEHTFPNISRKMPCLLQFKKKHVFWSAFKKCYDAKLTQQDINDREHIWKVTCYHKMRTEKAVIKAKCSFLHSIK